MKVDIVGGADPVQVVEAEGFTGRQVGLQVRDSAPAPVYWGRIPDEADADQGWELMPGDSIGVELRNGQDVWVSAQENTSVIVVVL